MRSRPDPRPRLAPLRRPPASAGTAPAVEHQTGEMMPAEPELGGWVPAVDRAPDDDDLLSEWAPRTGRGAPGRHRTAAAAPASERSIGPSGHDGRGPVADPPVLRLVPVDREGWPDDGSAGDDRDEEWSIDGWPDDDGRGEDRGSGPTPVSDEPSVSSGADPAAAPPADPDSDLATDTVEPDIEAGTGFGADPDPDADGDPDPDADVAGGEPARARMHRINGRWGRFAELWVPESMREARVDPGRRGMLVLVLVAAVAAVVAAVGVWRDRPEPRPIETAVVAAASAPPAAPVSAAAASPAAAVGAAGTSGAVPTSAPAEAAVTEILVSVTGLVASPGVVRLAPEARVADAIAAAGGTRPGADLTGMNLAAKLADGDSVVVTDTASTAAASGGGPAGGSGGAATQPAGGLVNLNTADEAALDTLPGVGPVMAQNILAWRETNGNFNSIEQLQEISGIGPSRYAQLAPLVTVG